MKDQIESLERRLNRLEVKFADLAERTPEIVSKLAAVEKRADQNRAMIQELWKEIAGSDNLNGG